MNSYNFNHLYYFYVTAKLGGVSNAAKFLHISQPSLSTQLKNLESHLGKRLFDKKGRRLTLNNEGTKIYAYCKKMFNIAEEMNAFVRSPEQEASVKVRIGVSDQIERPFIADILSPVLQDKTIAKRNSFFITANEENRLVTSLRSQEIDLLLTNKPVYDENLIELASVSMPVNLLVSSESLRNLRSPISVKTNISDLMNAVPWGLVMPSEILKLRQETDIFFQEIKTRKRIIFESDILSVVARAILDGVGFGFLPTPYAREEIKLNLLSVFGPPQGYWQHMLYLIARRQDSYEPAILEIKKNLLALNVIP